MSNLLVSYTSPYSSKVRMAAAHIGYPVKQTIVDTAKAPPELTDANPLGKIPVLISEKDGAIFDSAVIMQYLNRESGGKLYPRAATKRLDAERMEAMADGICDSAIAWIYEKRQRPEDKQHQPWLDKQWSKVTRALDAFEAGGPKLPTRIHGGHIALAAALGYMNLRFPGWDKKGYSKLKRFIKRYREKFPALAEMLPKQV